MLKLRRGRLALISAVAALAVLGVSSAASADIRPFNPGHNIGHVNTVVNTACNNPGLSGQACTAAENVTIQVAVAAFNLVGQVSNAVFGPTGILAQAVDLLVNVYGQAVTAVGFDPVDVVIGVLF